MLPARHRLSRPLFTEIAPNGALSVYNTLGTLKYIPSETLHVSVVTSSKNQKKAVLRNKLRRQIYTVIREASKNTPFLVFMGALYVSKQSYTYTYEEITRLTQDLLAKVQKNNPRTS